MVTVIHSSESLRNALNYNERKVQQNKAACLMAVNYPKGVEDLNFYQKLYRLTNQAALNHRTKVNSVHISINFEPSEKLSQETLEKIAATYMERIGFGGQPYLVYEHRDAGHPHLHIITTNIRPNGKRIGLHNLGKNQSEKARKSIEKDFGLIKAEERKQSNLQPLQSVAIKKVVYGESETKRAITNVLDAVLTKYKYTSLEQLNTLLRMAGVEASRGSKDSRTYKNNGLFFQVLDEDGKPVGVPIKASSIYSKPTLPRLQEKFVQHARDREGQQKRIRLAVDWYFLKTKQPTREGLKGYLEKDGISIVEHKSKDNRIFGLSYVDHRSGYVFKGSEVGKEYAAKGIEEHLREQEEVRQGQALPKKQWQKEWQPPAEPRQHSYVQPAMNHKAFPESEEHGREATATKPDYLGALPYELKNNLKKKKRRRKHLSI